MDPLRLAVVGVGHLGKEHARILAGMPDVELIGVVDQRFEQAQTVALRSHTTPYTDHHHLLDKVDAAVIAVPTIQHHPVALDFLRRGVPLLVEKPLTHNLEQANELVAAARRQGLLLQVGHIERFNPAFEEIQDRPLQPKLINCRRLAPFSGRSMDIGVVLDLMIHDLDMILTLVGAPVQSVSALGMTLLGEHEDIVQAHLTFTNGCVANLSASRLHPEPVRQMEIWAPEGFVQLDYHRRHVTMVQPSEQFRRWQRQGKPLDTSLLASFRTGLHGQHLQRCEYDCNRPGPDQLTRELRDFVDSVRHGGTPRVSGEQGRQALGVAIRILESINHHAWNGHQAGPVGPNDLPAPLGSLFAPARREAAA